MQKALIVILLFFGLNAATSIAQRVPVTYIEMDFYPVPDKLLKSEKSAHQVECDGVFSYDRVWFQNEKMFQGLIIELATDNHHLREFRYFTDDFPLFFIEQLFFNDSIGNLTSIEKNTESISCFLAQARYLKPNYFETNQGINLGISSTELFQKFGEPTSRIEKYGCENLSWMYFGDQLEDESTLGPRLILAKNSYGYEVTAVLKNDRLIGYLIFKDIP